MATNEQARTVLVVDDDPTILAVLKRQLARTYRVLTASSGQEALAVLEEEQLQVVVSDYAMPGMTGVELLATTKERWPNTTRILLTGEGSLDIAIEAINKGEVYRFLRKPCNPRILEQALRQGIELYELLRESRRLLSVARRQQELLREASPNQDNIVVLASDVAEDIEITIDVSEMTQEIRSALDDIVRAD